MRKAGCGIRFNSDLTALLATPEMKERLLAAGIDACPSTLPELHERITRDIIRWAEIVEKSAHHN